jgi:peptide/nickel transport system permease protein
MTIRGHTLRIGLRLAKSLAFGVLAVAVAMAPLAAWQPQAAWTAALALAVGVGVVALLALPEELFAVAFRIIGAIVFGTLGGWLAGLLLTWLADRLTMSPAIAGWAGLILGSMAGLAAAAVLALCEMGAYILRRLWWASATVFGVMIFTFLLFRVGAGDIAAANLGETAPERQKAAWRHLHGYDRPWILNLHRSLVIEDRTMGLGQFRVDDAQGGLAVESLALILDSPQEQEAASGKRKLSSLVGRYVLGLSPATPIGDLAGGSGLLRAERPAESQAASSHQVAPGADDPGVLPLPPGPLMVFTLSDETTVAVSVEGLQTAGDLIDRINHHPASGGRLTARITDLSWSQVLNSQFFRHLRACILFDARSLKGDNRTLTEIISQHAPYTLAVQIPVLGIEWCLALAVACLVAYCRGTLVDKVGVFLTVLGMCIPFLAFMIFGQWAMFAAGYPQHAHGLAYRGNMYVPIAIMVLAGLGGHVRFYRTVILDETGRDYVRTARSKGLPLPTILFKHVLRNCMLPILTSLILSIPFLIMGSLLVESYFGIPGLGDLMITSVQDRNEPVMNGMVFLTALIYTLGVLMTDVCYGIFDPRIRLR